MNRRNFLQLLGCCTLYGPIVQVPQTTAGQRIGILADTQMSPNVPIMFSLMAQRPVDYWLHAGDVVSIDGDTEANWQYTRAQLDSLGKPVYAVPGNHDFVYQSGNHATGPAEPIALAKWAEFIGPLQFVRDTQYSRFIGLNYLDWSAGNQQWLASQLATAKRKVIISHYPLGSVVGPQWIDVNAAAKRAFFETHGVSLFICGHRHHFIVSQLGALRQVVAPAISFVAGPYPDAVAGGITPMSYPALGWLELIDSPEQFVIEFYRWDGLKAWTFATGIL